MPHQLYHPSSCRSSCYAAVWWSVHTLDKSCLSVLKYYLRKETSLGNPRRLHFTVYTDRQTRVQTIFSDNSQARSASGFRHPIERDATGQVTPKINFRAGKVMGNGRREITRLKSWKKVQQTGTRPRPYNTNASSRAAILSLVSS